MKRLFFIAAVLLGLLAGAPLRGQQHDDGFLPYIIEQGDTTYVDQLIASWSFPNWNRRSKEYKDLVKLLYNFNKVYPYAQLGKELILTVDQNLEGANGGKKMSRLKKDRYINSVQNQLLKDFDKDIRRMTISQGKLLMRLIDREIGMTSYNIVKDYKNGIAAGFWQGIAKVFGHDLKQHYDPEGADAQTERLVQIWESGQFESYYYAVTGELPVPTRLPSKYTKGSRDPFSQQSKTKK